jgi:hypothetical protein
MESTSGTYVLSAGRRELDRWKDRIRSKFLEVGSPSTNDCIIVSYYCLIGVTEGIERIVKDRLPLVRISIL